MLPLSKLSFKISRKAGYILLTQNLPLVSVLLLLLFLFLVLVLVLVLVLILILILILVLVLILVPAFNVKGRKMKFLLLFTQIP